MLYLAGRNFNKTIRKSHAGSGSKNLLKMAKQKRIVNTWKKWHVGNENLTTDQFQKDTER